MFSCKTVRPEFNDSIPNTLEESFLILDTLLADSLKNQFAKYNEDEAIVMTHHGLGMYLRNEWGLWRDSRLAKYFNEMQIRHPDDMSSIILTSYHRYLNQNSINLQEQIDYYTAYWNNNSEVNIAKQWPNEIFLMNNNILVKQLPKISSDEILFTCDSTLIVKRKNPSKKSDIELWTTGSTHFVDSNQLMKYLDSDLFGEKIYIEGVNYQGNIGVVRLKENRFKVVNDTLKELKVFYTVPYDSITNMNMFKFNNISNEEIVDSINYEISKLKSERYKVIFHPDFFETDNRFFNSVTNDTIILEKHWVVDDIDVYRIRIKGMLGKSKTSYSYLIDENYKFLDYEGCNTDLTKQLNLENLKNQK